MATLWDLPLEMVLRFIFGKGACPTHKRVPFGHLKCSTMAHMLYLIVILGITTLPRISTMYESNIINGPFWTILPRIFDVRDTPHFLMNIIVWLTRKKKPECTIHGRRIRVIL